MNSRVTDVLACDSISACVNWHINLAIAPVPDLNSVDVTLNGRTEAYSGEEIRGLVNQAPYYRNLTGQILRLDDLKNQETARRKRVGGTGSIADLQTTHQTASA